MTDEELKALVAENSRAIAENRREIRDLRAESEKQRREDRRSWEQLRKELRASRAESERIWQEVLASRKEYREAFDASKEESERKWRKWREELRVSKEESERIWQEVLASRKEHDRTIRGLHREYGRLGNAIGGYAESLLRPSLERLLRERFGMTAFHAPLRLKDGGESLEIDLVGHAKDAIREVYAVEIKNKLRPGDFDQLFEHLRKLPRLVPEHRGKKLFGILAALEIDDQLRARAMREGIYLATIKDDIVELSSPDGFEPHVFGLRSLG